MNRMDESVIEKFHRENQKLTIGFAHLPVDIIEKILTLVVHQIPKLEMRCMYSNDSYPRFKDFLKLCQISSSIRAIMKSSVYLNSLILTWSAQKQNEMIPFWIATSLSTNICGLVTEVFLDNHYYGRLPYVTACSIAVLFKKCPNLKSIKIIECENFSLPELRLMLLKDQEIVCTLDNLKV